MDLSKLSSQELMAMASKAREAEEAREKNIPHYKTYGEAAAALKSMRDDLFSDEKEVSLKSKLGMLVHFGALDTTPLGCIKVSSLENFALYGSAVTIQPEMLVSERQCERSKKPSQVVEFKGTARIG